MSVIDRTSLVQVFDKDENVYKIVDTATGRAIWRSGKRIHGLRLVDNVEPSAVSLAS